MTEKFANWGEALAEAIALSIKRNKAEVYFSQPTPNDVYLSIETYTGSHYDVFLAANSTPEQVRHEDADTQGEFWVKPGSVIRNGKDMTGKVGFNADNGVILVLGENDEMLMRSSSIKKLSVVS